MNTHVYSLNSTSFVAFKDIELHDGFATEFEIRLSEWELLFANKSLVLANFEVYSKKNRQKTATYYLEYDLRGNQVRLVNGPEGFFTFGIDLEDGFWHRLKVEFFSGRLFVVFAGDAKGSAPFAHQDSYVKIFVGGSADVKRAAGIRGCVRGLDERHVVLRESANVGKGCAPQYPTNKVEIFDIVIDFIALQLKPRKGRDIKRIPIESIYSLFIQISFVYVFNQYPFNIPTFSWF